MCANEQNSPEKSPQPAAQPGWQQVVAATVLAIDWGAARIGVAIKPAGQDWVLPRAVLTPRNQAHGIELLHNELKTSGASILVVGLPLHEDGSTSEQARTIKRFCRRARETIKGVRWCFVNEASTTREAEALAREAESTAAADDLAAKLILETYLNQLPRTD